MNKQTLGELVKEEQREYYREWRAKNKDKVAKHNADYWKRRAEKRLAAQEESHGK